ncbi:hypothetical protein [Flavobacterium coralii]|uniref:hypothetical protein n=1 Tax=Flavobacterium coralii TaxID=2838017 RepID=UPI000C4B207B|nr:hypothetical protein [Flavobacterium sp.]|tara:strand:- start:19531 stop:21897 length:2367 start_codon:yes stop_codon:yes gene_type:complete
MKKTVFILTFICCFTSFLTFAQEAKKEQISKVLNDYFFLERENIHAHFDKDVFLTDEKVWFKGYVYHRKTGKPFYSCVNIFASLIDDSGKVLDSQLLYGNIGTFSGSFSLDTNLPTGRYYVQFYTNWMNNFSEDESFVKEIRIINKNAPALLNAPNYSKINIALHPEGGKLIAGINNNIALSITDCNNRPVTILNEAHLTDSEGRILKTVAINDKGFGKFDYVPESGKVNTVSVKVNGTEHKQQLPYPQLTGAAIEVNSFAMPGKTIVKVRTAKAEKSNNALFLLAHKDEKSVIFDVKFEAGKNEEVLVISNTDLFEGLNTFRLLDGNLNELANRVFYIYPEKNSNNINLTYTKDANGNIELSGNVYAPNMNLSISMLPSNTLTVNEESDIYNSLLLAPYLDSSQGIAARNYLSDANRRNQFELDLFLVGKSSKYKWVNIKNNPPTSNYTFDIGLALKGTVNQNLRGSGKYKLQVSSFSGQLDEILDINDNNEFYLDHLILADSTKLYFMLLKGDEKKEVKLYPQILNNKRVYNKSYKPTTSLCRDNNAASAGQFPELPDYLFLADATLLEEVKIEADPNRLKYKNAFGNSQLRSYKITETESTNFFYITDLIRSHGFDVNTNGGTVSITGRSIRTINGQKTTPMVYIDNIFVMDYDVLFMMQTADVDEFYINQHAVVPSVDNREGIIKIYMKKNISPKSKGKSATSFIVAEGFSIIDTFKNSQYLSTATKGFENFGIIGWEPIIATDEKGHFKVSVPYSQQDSVKVLIEGIGPDGRIISQVKTISLN